MTRLNTDNLAAFLSVETPAADSPALRNEPDAKPFETFLQRAGQSPHTVAEDAARERESGPIDAQSNSTEQDVENPTEPDREPEENRDTSESTADAGDATPEGDETDEQVDAASNGCSDENTDGKEQTAVGVDVTEIGSSGAGQESGDEADPVKEEVQPRESRGDMRNGHEDRQSESGAVQDAKATDASTSGRSEQTGQEPVEPETPTGEEKPTDLRRQGEEQKPVGSSEVTPQPNAGGHETVTESEDKSQEKAAAQSRIDNPLAPIESPQERRRRASPTDREERLDSGRRSVVPDRCPDTRWTGRRGRTPRRTGRNQV